MTAADKVGATGDWRPLLESAGWPGAWLARHGAALALALTVAAYLAPLWAFRYLPTQDGPSHVANAIILKDYGTPGTRYHEFFEIRCEHLPNWTSHLLLAGLMYVVPPGLAEKLLVSFYVVGLALSFRYFLGAFGPATASLAPVGLLFVYNRCLWMGFYNYCLSLIPFWLVLGLCLRRCGRLALREALALALLFLAAYFTHLVGFLLAAAGAIWLAASGPGRRWPELAWLAVSLIPASLLALDYLGRTGFFSGPGAGRLGAEALYTAGGQRGLPICRPGVAVGYYGPL